MTQLQPRPDQRIVTISWKQYNRLRISTPELLADPFTRVVAVPLRPPDSEDPTLVALGSVIGQPDKILLRSFSGSSGYVDAVEAYEVVSLEKSADFAHVCQLLGATSLKVEEIRELSADGKVSAALKFNAKIAVGGTDFTRESSKLVAQHINATWTWHSGTSNLQDAEKYALDKGLMADSTVRGLIQQRNYTANPLRSHTLELEISSEARRIIAATLQAETVIKSYGPGFDAAFAALRQQTDRLVLSVAVTF